MGNERVMDLKPCLHVTSAFALMSKSLPTFNIPIVMQAQMQRMDNELIFDCSCKRRC